MDIRSFFGETGANANKRKTIETDGKKSQNDDEPPKSTLHLDTQSPQSTTLHLITEKRKLLKHTRQKILWSKHRIIKRRNYLFYYSIILHQRPSFTYVIFLCWSWLNPKPNSETCTQRTQAQTSQHTIWQCGSAILWIHSMEWSGMIMNDHDAIMT